jgi:xanthine dehydrogenase YagS FAD-binding subunit
VVGAPGIPDTFREAAQAELRHAVPLARNAYKLTLARNLITATLRELSQ